LRILLVHNRYVHEGGEEESVDSLDELLNLQGHQVHRLERSSREWLNHSMYQQVIDGLQVISSSISSNLLTEEVHRFKPDLVHFHNLFPVLSPSVLVTAHRMGLPIVQTLHNYRWLCANGLFLTPQGQVCEKCKRGNFLSAVRFGCYGNQRLRTIPMAASLWFHSLRKTAQQCIDRFISPSHFLRSKYLEAGWPADRIDVIANPTRTKVTMKTIRSDDPVFLYVGRLSREKGIQTLLQAFTHFNAPGRLILAGDGPLLEHCQQRRSDRIEVLGRISRERVFKEMEKAWALIMPSECFENLPQAVLEAWHTGTPVIASRLGGLSELIQENLTGWTFEPGNASDLAKRLSDVANNPQRSSSLSVMCRQHVKDAFNNEEIYAKLIKTYELARQRRTSAIIAR